MESEVAELDYSKLKDEVVRLLRKAKHMVLATSADNRVTARTVSCVNDGLTIFCQTDRTYTKCRQVAENPNVALCVGNMQIEGSALIRGHPLSDENKQFVELFRKKHSRSFELYSHLDNEVVIEIRVKRVILWKYELLRGRSHRDFLEIADERAYRKFTA